MITYKNSLFGFQLLTRLHGSALFKSLTPALISNAIYLALYHTLDLEEDQGQILSAPYAIGALLSSFMFLLQFRANFAYNRYWEATTSVHQMQGKWIDCGSELAAFHLQAKCYDNQKPPAFGMYPELRTVHRQRERLKEPTIDELEDEIDAAIQDEQQLLLEQESFRRTKSHNKKLLLFRRRSKKSVANQPPSSKASATTATTKKNKASIAQKKKQSTKPKQIPLGKSINAVTQPTITTTTPEKRTLGGMLFGFGRKVPPPPGATQNVVVDPDQMINVKSQKNSRIAWEHDKPPLFLQEAAHLLSLLSAVSLSTLRNDLEGAASPLITFTPGAPWPHADPDAYSADVRKDWEYFSTKYYHHRSLTLLQYLLGYNRTPESRALYNAARPFRVIGGVSDAEIQMLQQARGPVAKVAMVSMWFQDFLSREVLAGSTGNVAPPILSRLYQLISDGMLGYNQARKISYNPFPFPHAQLTSFFVLVVVGILPVLMLSYLQNEPFGFFLNFLTVMSFTGLHEVARELEMPFKNAPNDIPLNNFQAQYNESLMTLFAGFHPDAHWEINNDNEGEYPPSPPAAKTTTTTTTDIVKENPQSSG